jgi:pimeloyl-ACP methyl ester carboxylesterase
LFDLLTAEEDQVYTNRFDIELLARRLGIATEWATGQRAIQALPLGYFGASTGAAAALQAAGTTAVETVRAVVSRGGRPDLAGPALGQVRAATLLIVGGEDRDVLALNRAAYAALHCQRELSIVPGATHLFEEPGALQSVAELAAAWFLRWFLGQG